MKSAGEIVAARRLKQANQAASQELSKLFKTAQGGDSAPLAPVAPPSPVASIATVVGLDTAFERFSAELSHLAQAIGRLQFQLPEPVVHLHDLKLPEPQVTVEIPPIHVDVPKAEVVIQREVATAPKEIIETNYTYAPNGDLASVTDRYSDGTFRRARGFDIGRIRYERG